MEVEEKLRDRIKGRFTFLENSFKEVLDDIRDALDDISGESEKLKGSREAFADLFGGRVSSLVSGLTQPPSITQNDLKRYIASLEDFQREIIYYGARWVRKIGFRHRFTISRIENGRRRALALTKNLRDLLSTHQDDLKRWEKAEAIARKISRLEGQESSQKNALKTVDAKLEALNRRIVEAEREIGRLQGMRELKDAREAQETAEAFEEKVKRELRHLEKPVSKALRLIERGVLEDGGNKILILKRLLKDPKHVLLDGDAPSLEEAFTILQVLLKEQKLNLKGSRNRKAQEAIATFLEGEKIRVYRDHFAKYAEDRRRRGESTEALEKARRLGSLTLMLKRMKGEFEELTRRKEKLKREISLTEEKASDYRSKLDALL